MVFVKSRVLMFVGVGAVVFICLFLVGSVCGAESSSVVNLTVPGCTFYIAGPPVIPFGVSEGECSTGVVYGYYYCVSEGFGYVTTQDNVGCSRGDAIYTLGTDPCCPSNSGLFCNNTADGISGCDRRLANCVDQNNSADCLDNGCVWMDITGECTDDPKSYDCSYYDTNAACLEDKWHLGSSGIGTELCGSTIECDGREFSIPVDNCTCEWYPAAPVGEQCQVNVVAVEKFYSPTSAQDIFECSSVYDLGACVEGSQNVTWYTTNTTVSGFSATAGVIPEECLIALNCMGGESSRFCGEPIVKLSGFSLLVALFVIGIYYLVLGKFKYRRKLRLS
jgi:hypothetical protein